MKPAEQILKDIIDNNLDRLKMTFGDTINMKVQDITGRLTPDIAASLVTGRDDETDDYESEDTDGNV